MFEIEAQDRDHYAIFRITGTVSLADAVDFTHRMQSLLTTHPASQYLLDLNQVRMDNAGLGVLVSLSTSLQGRGRRFVLLQPDSHVLQLLHAAHIESFFPTCDSEAELKQFGKAT